MADRKNIEALVSELIAEIAPPGKDRAAITLDSNLRSDLGLDSLRLAAFLIRCGEQLGIDEDDLIESVDVSRMQAVGDVVAMCERLLAGGGAP
jgi:acyl carrier protein